MVFSSIIFLFAYLPLTLVLYYITPLRFRNGVLFILNLVFYAWGEPRYVVIMLLSTIIDYVHGFLVEKWRDNDKKARRAVASSVVFNLGILFFFKYFDFFAASLAAVFPGFPLKPLGISLPIGISFYTFQTMSYTIDVYRRDAERENNIIRFGTFVTLFPQLIAGPIIRFKDLATQLKSRTHTAAQFSSGIQTFICGLCKKVLLANNIGLLWDTCLAADDRSIIMAWLGALAFTFQIYFDFSGYSDMAMGLGRMFGFEFIENFNYPFISKNVTEFWRRWHISLGTWFREYVYIPLGGNRGSTFKNYRNIFIVWALTGLWHGASWNFVLWGVYFAVILIIEKSFLLKWLNKRSAIVTRLYSFLILIISFVIFGITDFTQLGGYLQSMFSGRFVTPVTIYYLKSYAVTFLLLIFASTPKPKELFSRLIQRHHWLLYASCILGLILSVAYIVDSTYNPFLYFRF